MSTQRTAVLFDSLERLTVQGLGEIMELRRQIATLRAENDRLRRQLQAAQHEPFQAAHATEPSSNRLSVLPHMAAERGYPLPRRAAPRPSRHVTHDVPNDAPAFSTPTPDTSIPDEADNGLPRQSRLAIGEAPSPQALLDEWYRRYTDTFFKGHTRPLKVGIHEDLTAHEPWPDKLVRRALACYVHLPRYLKAVRVGAERVDLQGRPAGVVSESEARHAHKKLETLQAQQRKREKSSGKSAGQHKGGGLDRKLSELLAKHSRH